MLKHRDEIFFLVVLIAVVCFVLSSCSRPRICYQPQTWRTYPEVFKIRENENALQEEICDE